MTFRLDDLDRLRAGIAGRVIDPHEGDYDGARAVANGEIDRRPAAVARCAGAADVASVIRFARDIGLDLTVRGGGHNPGGAAVADGALMIHLGDLNSVTVDPVAQTARCGGGATLAQLDAATQEFGLATPAGTVSHTGVGGLTLGGGMGYLSREYGLTCDNLLSATVVTADGRTLRAAADEHPDLFWALRGGGGNFGVVTEFEFRLHPVGPIVQVGLLFWEAARGREALRLARDIIEVLPAGTSALLATTSAAPAPFVPEKYHFALGCVLVLVGLGSEADHLAVVNQARSLPPAVELVTPMPYVALQQMLDESMPWGSYVYEKSLYLSELSDEVIALAMEQLPGKRSPLSFTPAVALGGAVTSVDVDATAFGGPRQPALVYNLAAVAPTPELLDADRAWVQDYWDKLLPHALGSGSYVNFMTEFEDDRIRASFGAAKYARLAEIKATYDPDNVFHHNANIRPALSVV